eukprot:m.46254 g.46254  ORF g.46254 m.46254 type:complete len:469 (+) comp11105_c0_seq1:224-1630(+)
MSTRHSPSFHDLAGLTADPRTSKPLQVRERGLSNSSAGLARRTGVVEDELLGELAATALCGNDITSSCLYVAGVCTYYSGFWAPLCIFFVSFGVLHLYRGIYTTVVSALPFNGGAYTVLLNTTNKPIAITAGLLTFSSYISTAVVSATVAVSYIHHLVPWLDEGLCTVLILWLFAVLNFIGLRDSANVAVFIFVAHLSVLALLILSCLAAVFTDGTALFHRNFEHRYDTLPDGRSPMPLHLALLYGFASAMLGITGFETSANFVEEQRPGVFPRTLRNMWFCVALLNPALSLLSLFRLPLFTIMGYPLNAEGQPNNDDLLGLMAPREWLRTLVSIDAFCVLCGSVLTSYVGVVGLARRMAQDRHLPALLLGRNRTFGTNHTIIFGFFVLCWLLYAFSRGDVLVLGSVYAISFLCVMALFAIGALALLRSARQPLKPHTVAPILLALAAVVIAVVVNGFIFAAKLSARF